MLLTSPLAASQNFEVRGLMQRLNFFVLTAIILQYKMSNILDKPLEVCSAMIKSQLVVADTAFRVCSDISVCFLVPSAHIVIKRSRTAPMAKVLSHRTSGVKRCTAAQVTLDCLVSVRCSIPNVIVADARDLRAQYVPRRRPYFVLRDCHEEAGSLGVRLSSFLP